MATLERPRDAPPAADLNGRLNADAPSAFPVDELVALREQSSGPSSQAETGAGPAERQSEIREVGELPLSFLSRRRLRRSNRLTRSCPLPLTTTAGLIDGP